jgi:hypothetical protein
MKPGRIDRLCDEAIYEGVYNGVDKGPMARRCSSIENILGVWIWRQLASDWSIAILKLLAQLIDDQKWCSLLFNLKPA